MKTVSLVLGSGGARGLAHIGIIRWLEEHDYRIESISGCSIGALVGGIYAAGKLDLFEEWVGAVTRRDIVSLLDLSWKKSGLMKGDKIIDTLIDLVGNQQIEDLSIRYTAVAADIKKEKEVWINKGSLFEAIRCSISLPLFFTPHEYRGVKLIDGGVLNPVPIAPTFSDGTDCIIAINLSGPVSDEFTRRTEKKAPEEDYGPIRQKLNEYIQQLSTMVVGDGFDWNMYDVANQAFDAMQGTIARAKLAAYPPDVTLEIPRNACGILEFDCAREMIELGYKTAQRELGKGKGKGKGKS